jgi:hypothetical protein
VSLARLLDEVRGLLASRDPDTSFVRPANPALASLISRLQAATEERTARAFLVAHAAAIDLPVSSEHLPAILAALHAPLRTLIRQAAAQLTRRVPLLAQLDQIATAFPAILAAATAGLPNPVWRFPFARFHDAFRPVPPDSDPRIINQSNPMVALHSRCALGWHLQLRELEAHMSPAEFPLAQRRQNVYRHSVALVRFISYLVKLIPPDTTPDFTCDQLVDLLPQFQAALRGVGYTPSSAAGYANRVRRLILGETIKARPEARGGRRRHARGGVQASPARRPPEGAAPPRSAPPPPRLPAGARRRVVASLARQARALDEGESAYEQPSSFTLDAGPAPDEDPYVSFRRTHARTARQARDVIGTPWQLDLSQADHAQLCAQAMRCLANPPVSPRDVALALLVIYAIAPARLLDAAWEDEEPAAPGQLRITPEGGALRYQLGLKELGWLGRELPGGPDRYRPGGGIVSLPLGCGFATALTALRQAGGVTAQPFAAVEAKDLYALAQRWLGRGVGLEALRAAAQRWIQVGGLPRVYAALLSGSPSTAERATLFYVNARPAQLASAHAASLARVNPGQGDLVSALLLRPRREDLPAFGSRIVPQPAPVNQAFAAVRARLAVLGQGRTRALLARRHNLRTVYSLLAWFWGSAARPTEGGIPEGDDLLMLPGPDGPELYARITDKDNRSHREGRIVPVAPELAAIIAGQRAWNAGVRSWLRATTIPTDGITENTIFFLIEDGGTAALTAPERQCRPVLDKEGLLSAYPYPLNVPRHYWITWCLNTGVPLDELEPLLGHTHPGHEPLAWYVLPSLRRATRQFLIVATAILAEMNIISVEPDRR